jgi:Xaa-Pro aminopeptidase
MATEILPDDKDLRDGRRRRVFAEMARQGIDVLLLGREANARYVSGANRLWTAGTRPYGPGCVAVASTGAVHLVSTWDEGIPDDIPREHLLGITWNPGTLLAWLQGIEGVAGARRIGTDSLTPRFARLLPKLFGQAELVDAEPMLEAVRRVKTPEELGAIRRSVAVAERALAVAVDELRPGLTERHLTGVFMEAMARQGVTTPVTQRVARVASVPGGGPPPGDRTVGPGDLVVFDAGVVAGGYSGEVGRTWPADPGAAADHRALVDRVETLWDRLQEACRPGSTGRDLLAVYEAEGCPAPSTPVAWGLGLGFDGPVVDASLPATAAGERLEAGMVLALTASVAGAPGTVVRKESLVITADGAEVLSRSPRWRSAAEGSRAR